MTKLIVNLNYINTNNTGEAPVVSALADPQVPKKLLEVVELMQNNVEEVLSKEDFFSLLGIRKRQLERYFNRYLGVSPSRYYMILRIKRAHKLLVHSQLSKMGICFACGFVSYPHFSKTYKSIFKATPSQTKNHNKGDSLYL